MLASQIPTKFGVPFANSAGAGFITPIPEGSQIGVSAGRASLTDGFPPVTFVPIGAGGIPPWGADFNGLFNQITAWNRWTGAGGEVPFDTAFATKIGGYPQGALLRSTSSGNMWVSLLDNNLVDPDGTPGAPGWVGVAFIQSIQNGSYISADDTGAVNTLIAAPTPAPAAYVKYQKFQVKVGHTTTTSTPTLNIMGPSGLLGAKTIIHDDGSPLASGELIAGMIASFIYDGASFQYVQSRASLKTLWLAGSGQSVPRAVITKINCYSTVLQNTLVTSVWNNTDLIIGSGESGLWSFFHGLTFGNQNSTAVYVAISRTRGVTVNYFEGFTTYPGQGFTGLADAFATTTQILDLQVGDVVNFYVTPQGPQTSYVIQAPSGSGSGLVLNSVVAYRIEGLSS